MRKETFAKRSRKLQRNKDFAQILNNFFDKIFNFQNIYFPEYLSSENFNLKEV